MTNQRDVKDVFLEAGYTVIEGADAVTRAIGFTDDRSQWLCSGYKVFPDGSRCEGCEDCSP